MTAAPLYARSTQLTICTSLKRRCIEHDLKSIFEFCSVQISEEVTNMMNGVGGALTAEQIEAQMEQMLNDLPVMANTDMAGDVPNSMGELLANMAGVMPRMSGAARAAA